MAHEPDPRIHSGVSLQVQAKLEAEVAHLTEAAETTRRDAAQTRTELQAQVRDAHC